MRKIFTVVGLAILVGFAWAEPNQGNLKNVKKAIQTTQVELKGKQQKQHNISEKIKDIEQEISQQKKELNKIEKERLATAQKLSQMRQALQIVKNKVEHTQAQVSRLINAQYKNQQADALVLMLQNMDPNEKGRQLYYLSYIQKANKDIFTNLLQQQQQLNQQAIEIEQSLKKLQLLSQRSQTIIKNLHNKKNIQLQSVGKLNIQIDQDSDKLKKLQNNEKKLTHLLAKIAKEQAAKKAAERQKALEKKKKAIAESTTKGTLTVEDLQLDKEDIAESMSNIPGVTVTLDSLFSRQQGKLLRPIAAEVTGVFGTANQHGEIWKGVFYTSSPQAVKAIYQGDIVYAGHLDGYGKTVIIDHEGGYLSIYTGLSKVNTVVGKSIKTGTVIAQSGNIPNGDVGLYLEIRYQTKALNPQVWIQ